ncbi:MAG: hypothetical protein ACJASQ_003170 [Crocinitomicaceae bacterium]|jgi:hypothetical protein
MITIKRFYLTSLLIFLSQFMYAQCTYTPSFYAINSQVGTGTPVSLSVNTLSSAIPIGFNFDFYCNSYTDAFISSNGFITFDAASGPGTGINQTPPDLATPNNFIASGWTALDPTGGTIEYFTTGTAPNRRFVVRYSNVVIVGTAQMFNSEIVLWETSNEIELNIVNVAPAVGSPGDPTMGVENSDGSEGLAFISTGSYPVQNVTFKFIPQCTSTYGTDTQASCGSFTWIDGNTYASSTNTPTHTISGGASTGCDSIVTLNLTVNNIQEQTLSAAQSTLYCPGATAISLQNSETGVDYFFIDQTQDTVIAGPTTGTGTALTFSTGTINSTMNYAVEAKSGFTAGAGVQFNGADEKIVVPSDLDFEFAIGTLESWIKPTGSSNYAEMFLAMRSGTNSSRYSFHVNAGSNYIGMWNGTTWSTLNYPLSSGTWYHVAFRITPTETEMYINGEYIGDLDPINTSIVGEDFVIGGSNDPGYPNERYFGQIDNVRVWNTLRTPTEIAKNMDMCLIGNEPGLVALYKLDDGTGSSVAVDATGNHDGALDASMDPATDWVAGVGCYTCRLEMASTAAVTLNPLNATGTDVQTACDSLIWIDGITYTSSNNTATQTLTNIYGCDSIVTLDLTIINATTAISYTNVINLMDVNFTNTSTVTGSNPIFSWSFGDGNTSTQESPYHVYPGPGVYNACLTVTDLCNTETYCSTITLCAPNASTDQITACNSLLWIDGNTYTSSNNTATQILTNMFGCDSTVTLDLTITSSTTATDVQTACDSYSWIDGNTYTASNNTATYTLTNAANCDSIVTLDLTINTVNAAITVSELTITADEAGVSYQWIDCGNNNDPISGETNQSFTATENGDYAVIVTMNNCSDTSACESITTVGLNDLLDEHSIVVSPNPSNDYFILEGDLLDFTNSMQVISIEGKRVFEGSVNSSSTFKLNAVNWTPGVYFLTLQTEQGSHTVKLIKE